MKLAFLYAGQGSQHPGMGRAFYESSPLFRQAYDGAPVDFDLTETCLDDPQGVLNQTAYTQPCLVAFAVGVTKLLKAAGLRPDYCAGLSLGEYSALHCAGVLDDETAISLAAFRGRAMAQAAQGVESAMMAVLNLDRAALSECCREASDLGVVEIANYNCPGQLVIGGEKAAVERAAALAREKGARRCLPLKVSGPFHTSLLAPAGDALRIPSPPCWSGRSSPASTWRTPFAVWRRWGWTLWWRSVRVKPCPASSARPPRRCKPMPWRLPSSWTGRSLP